MKAIKHLSEQPFVAIVGIAALIHSTWTVATFSGGVGPSVKDWITGLAWLWWVLPGFLAAFALEVGQVVTARQIQRGTGRKLRIWRWSLNVKTLTFVVLSAATYLLQLTYLLHHYPDLPIASGLSAASQNAAHVVMEIVIWGMPLLLPMSMLMFTAGDETSQRQPYPLMIPAAPVKVSCSECDWTKECSDALSAQNSLNGHMRSHSLIPLASTNGKH